MKTALGALTFLFVFASSTFAPIVASASVRGSKCFTVFAPSVDIAVVGAGPAGVTMAESLRAADPRLRVMVVEKSEDIGGTFRDHEHFYKMLTTFEETDVTSPAELKDILKKRFRSSGAELRLKTQVEGFEDHWNAGTPQDARYLLQARDFAVKAKTIVYATGQVPDALMGFSGSTRAFLETERARTDSKVFTFDEVIDRYGNSHERVQEIQRQAIAVFGSGVAAMNLVQFLKVQQDIEIYWFVLSKEKLEARIAGFDGRYAKILTDAASSKIRVVEADLQSIQRGRSGYLLQTGGGQFASQQKLTVAQVWLATGAQPPTAQTWLRGVDDAQILPVFDDTGERVANRLRIPGRPPQSVYVVGIASGATAMADAFPKIRSLAKTLTTPAEMTAELSEALQRRILHETVSMAPFSKHPEIIFLAGISGSGKTTWVESEVRHHVIIDPDRIRELIPGYIRSFEHDPVTAASKWHKAAIALQFPMVDQSLEQNRSMIIDGTMRDTVFFKSLIERIRRDYPHYKIKLVYAPITIAEAKRRIQRRSQTAGRYLPSIDFKKLDADVRKSVQTLSPLVDEFLVLPP